MSLYSIKGRLIRADIIMVFNILKGFCPNLGHLFVRNHCRDTRGHSFKLFVPRYNTDVRAHFFFVRVISIWNNLLEAVVAVDLVNAFKRHLDISLGQKFCVISIECGLL